ncbi:hypothetical protein MAR_023570 [Mya arenaria]|uniref:Tyr recombinase domain-containing protein n=1 Tax=Mya arenaria TaxID=6604 RepID=A0ABY7DR46_MYAAR|nr:hypothetical protein MAR_023570 [Mya arenaria]
MEFLKQQRTLSENMPASTNSVLLFTANFLADSTVAANLSSIAYSHNLQGWLDPTQTFLVRKCMQVYANKCRSPDKRLPITPELLRQLVMSLVHNCKSHYHRVLLKAMYLLAFHTFLRVGEMTKMRHKTTNGLLDLTISKCKHHHGRNITIQVHANIRQYDFFAVSAMHAYTRINSLPHGHFVSFTDGSPVSRKIFTDNVRLSLFFTGCDTALYKGHSFRIGAASYATTLGLSESQIQSMGRWRSRPMLIKYIFEYRHLPF